jgi:hypothetical protein
MMKPLRFNVGAYFGTGFFLGVLRMIVARERVAYG